MILNNALLILENVQGIEILTAEENEAIGVVFDFIAEKANQQDFDKDYVAALVDDYSDPVLEDPDFEEGSEFELD